MKTFIKYWNDNNPNDRYPTTPSVSGEWFAERGLPMVVACTCCQTTMALPSAKVDDDGYIYCQCCGE